MSSVETSAIVLLCVPARRLRRNDSWRPRSRGDLSEENKDLVKAGFGLVGTMTALLLGLLVASGKTSYQTRRG